MVQKAEISVEQFDNGISLRWKDAEEKVDPENRVALNGDEVKVIGETIWEDVKDFMFNQETLKVLIKVEYVKL